MDVAVYDPPASERADIVHCGERLLGRCGVTPLQSLTAKTLGDLLGGALSVAAVDLGPVLQELAIEPFMCVSAVALAVGAALLVLVINCALDLAAGDPHPARVQREPPVIFVRSLGAHPGAGSLHVGETVLDQKPLLVVILVRIGIPDHRKLGAGDVRSTVGIRARYRVGRVVVIGAHHGRSGQPATRREVQERERLCVAVGMEHPPRPIALFMGVRARGRQRKRVPLPRARPQESPDSHTGGSRLPRRGLSLAPDQR